MKLIAPSILSADFLRLGEEIKAVEDAGADILHIDVMDGHFVPNITIGPFIVEAIKKVATIPLDVHLMIENPDKYIKDFVNAGADWLTVHKEASEHIDRNLSYIKSFNVKTGISFNPATDFGGIEYYADKLDFILIMSVNPGFGGQKFIPSTLTKISNLKNYLAEKGFDIPVEVDGGIKTDNIKDVSDAGGDIFVSGTGIFKTGDYKKTISEMRRLID